MKIEISPNAVLHALGCIYNLIIMNDAHLQELIAGTCSTDEEVSEQQAFLQDLKTAAKEFVNAYNTLCVENSELETLEQSFLPLEEILVKNGDPSVFEMLGIKSI